MSQQCEHDHDRDQAGVLALDEQLFIDKVKTILVDAIAAYEAEKWYFVDTFHSKEIIITKRHRWLPWRNVVANTIPACYHMEGFLEFYNPNDYTNDGSENHYVIHLSFSPKWVRPEVINFMNAHGYRETEHSHKPVDQLPTNWQCGFLAFEPIR